MLTDIKKEVTVSTLVGRIPVIKNILGSVENNNIDLIVMGTQGKQSGLINSIRFLRKIWV